MTGELYNFKSAKPQTDFAPSWNFYIYENILNFDFDKVVNIILKKEKTIVKQYPPSNNGNTSLDNNSLTSRFPFFNVLKWKEMLFLKKLIKQNYNNYLNKIKLTPEKNIYLQCWANVLRKGEQIKLHEHDTSCFAYLSGNIIIKSNDTNTYYKNPIDGSTLKSKNKEGKLTLFPSYIGHYTDKVNDNEERISIAFDVRDEKGFNIDIKNHMKDHWVKL